jgi:hypothetical protein
VYPEKYQSNGRFCPLALKVASAQNEVVDALMLMMMLLMVLLLLLWWW